MNVWLSWKDTAEEQRPSRTVTQVIEEAQRHGAGGRRVLRALSAVVQLRTEPRATRASAWIDRVVRWSAQASDAAGDAAVTPAELASVAREARAWCSALERVEGARGSLLGYARAVSLLTEIAERVAAQRGENAPRAEALVAAMVDDGATTRAAGYDAAVATLDAMLPSEVASADYVALGRRVMHARRAQREAVREALDGIEDVAEGMEVLASRELVPMAWTEPGRRVFQGVVQTPWGPRDAKDLPRPATMGDLRAIASDPPGVETAEVLAQEFVEAVAPWSARPSTVRAVAWRFVDGRALRDLYHGPWPAVIERALAGVRMPGAAARWRTLRVDAAMRAVPWSSQSIGDAVRLCEWWRVMAERDEWVPAVERLPDALEGARWRALKNPFIPLLSLLSTGYAFAAYDGEVITLAAMNG